MTYRQPLFLTLLIAILVALTSIAFVLTPADAVRDLAHVSVDPSAYDVRIIRDQYGVPHIFGATDADVAFGLAFAHAEDDFLTTQQTLIAAKGKLASIYGPDAAPNDYMVALLRIDELVAREYPNLSPEVRAICEAYAAGLNYYASLHPNQAMPGLFPLTGQDIVAGSVHKSPLFFGLERTLGQLFGDTRPSEVSPRIQGDSPIPQLGVEQLFTNLSSHSNTAAVGPSRTADGSTFFLLNSHQPWTGPVAWYEAHLHSDEGWHFAGGFFPSMPVAAHGFNGVLSWAFTVNYPDLVDVYVLDIHPDDPYQYRVDGEWLTLESRQAPIEVNLIGRFNITVQEEVLWSIYGPALRQPHGTYAIRYAAMDSAGIYEQLYRMSRAQNFDEWYAAISEIPGLPNFSVGYADAEGNIFYGWNARMPVRSEAYNWRLYLPGDTTETLWTEYHPFSSLPQVLNPSAGFVQNANNTPYQTTLGADNPHPDDFSVTMGLDDVMSNRALRFLELYGADESITWEEFTAYKFDATYSEQSLVAEFQQRMIAMDFGDDPDLRLAKQLLAAWNREMTADNPAASLMLLTIVNLQGRDGVEMSFSRMVTGTASDAALASAFEAAVAHLVRHFGKVSVPLGDLQRLRRTPADLPLSGGPDNVRAIYSAIEPDGRMAAFNGDGHIMVVHYAPDGTATAYSVHQFGAATLDVNSPHYADQAPLFATHQFRRVHFTLAELTPHITAEYRPGDPR